MFELIYGNYNDMEERNIYKDLDYVNSYGNECAYTDRIVEEIIKTSKKIEKEYNKKWKSN